MIVEVASTFVYFYVYRRKVSRKHTEYSNIVAFRKEERRVYRYLYVRL
jgi:hypothetical protein